MTHAPSVPISTPATTPATTPISTGADWPQKIRAAAGLHAQGRLDLARRAYLELLQAQPTNPHIAKLLGLLEKDAGQLPMATRLLAVSMALQADFGTAMHLADVGRQQGDHALAKSSLEAALALRPDALEAWHQLAITLDQLGAWEAALAAQTRCLALAPDNANLHYNRGRVLHALGRYDEAAAAYTRALQLNPRLVAAAFNRGNSLHEALRLPEAIASFDLALAHQPDNANFHWSRALAALLHGDFESGWQHYERRWGRDGGEAQRTFEVPQWTGREALAGKTLLIHCEQGFGDVIQFARYALDVIARGGTVVFGAPTTLHPLLASMHPSIKTIVAHAEHPDFDFHCPVMSLPFALSTTLDTVPAPCPYFYAEAARVAAWQHRLGRADPARVGLVWFGNPKHLHDHRRSIALDALEPVLQLPLAFHSLQQETRAQDQAALARFPQIHNHGPELTDFSQTAALICALDLVVTVDTSIAHLAGALGKPVWILVHAVPDYRWLLGRSDSPWYPRARLFRQHQRNSWTQAIAELRVALRNHFGT
jgi:tetratricopeptide (TPR) repeat protein